jgi:hypothetical protein
MSVIFSGQFAINENFGINFEAHHNGNRVMCVASQEALQDINPPNRTDQPEQQFQDNQYFLQVIAEELIEAGHVQDGVLQINSSHVA